MKKSISSMYFSCCNASSYYPTRPYIIYVYQRAYNFSLEKKNNYFYVKKIALKDIVSSVECKSLQDLNNLSFEKKKRRNNFLYKRKIV